MERTLYDYLQDVALNESISSFLKACVISRCSLIVCGNEEKENVAFLQTLMAYIPGNERLVYVHKENPYENTRAHCVHLTGHLKKELVKASLRVRADRIVVDSVEEGCAFLVLQAMNTGHDGSMTSIIATSIDELFENLHTDIKEGALKLEKKHMDGLIKEGVYVIVMLSQENEQVVVSSIYINEKEFVPVVTRLNGTYNKCYPKRRAISYYWFKKIKDEKQLHKIDGLIDLSGMPKIRLKALLGES